MVNYIWFLMIITGIISFILNNQTGEIVKTMSSSAASSIELLMVLAGVMSIWYGIIKVCEKAGLVDIAAKILSLPLKILFPGLEKKSKKAMGSIVMNLASNMLGLSNAATPFGIKAMEELQKINPEKDRASDYMVTFIIINGACLQLIPSTVISIRAGFGAKDPSSIILPTILSTFIALTFGVISDAILRKVFK